MSNWPYVRFDQLGSSDRWSFSIGPFGSKVTTSDYQDDGVPLIRGINLARGIFVDENFVYISDTKADEIQSATACPGDLVFTRKGTIGQVSMIPRDPMYPRYVISGSQIKARLNPEKAIPEFYYYWFTSPPGRQSIVAHAVTTGVPSLANSLATIRGLSVPHPPISEQKSIAEMLGALDDKIAVNERIANASDELAEAVYTASIEADPEKFLELPLSESSEFINGRAFTKNATGTGRMVIRIAEINSGPGSSTIYNDIDVPENHLARPGDILFAWSGSLTVARWYRPEAVINQHIFKVIPKGERPNWLSYQLVRYKLEEFRAIAADKATTMGHIQRRHLDEPVLTPSVEMQQRLNSQIQPLWDRALAAEQESLALAELRDTLLPQLMSGKLRVRDAERIVESLT